MSTINNAPMSLITVREATASEVIAYHTANVAEVTASVTVASTKAVATGFWSGVKKGWATGKPSTSTSQYYYDEKTGRVIKA